MIVKDIVSAGRRVAVGVAGWLASQDRALANARRASTEVSRRRVERDEVSIYLGGLQHTAPHAAAEEWPDEAAQTAD